MSVKEVINTSYNMGVKDVFDALNDEIEDWSGIHKTNAEYLISIVKNLFEDIANAFSIEELELMLNYKKGN